MLESPLDLPTDCEIDGQAFAFVKATDYTCRDGRQIQLYRWQSACEACGAPYAFNTPSTQVAFEPTRRCKACRKPTSAIAAAERRAERAANVRALYDSDPSLERQFPNGLPDWLLDPETIR